jgi:hypothetical protein
VILLILPAVFPTFWMAGTSFLEIQPLASGDSSEEKEKFSQLKLKFSTDLKSAFMRIEQIIDTIADAIYTFRSSGLDYLLVSDKYLLSKS